MSKWSPIDDPVTYNQTGSNSFGAIQSLEIAYRMTKSHQLWASAFDDLILGFTMSVLGHLTRKKGYMDPRHGALSHVIAVCSYLGFLFSIMRALNWRLFMSLGLV